MWTVALANVFRVTLEVQVSPQTWSSEANQAAKVNLGLFGVCAILSAAAYTM